MCLIKTTMCIALSLTLIYKQFDSQGKGMMGGFNGDILKFRVLHNWALSWCKSKHTVCLDMPCWAGSSQAPGHEGFVVFGVCLSVCQHVGGFMGLLSSCAAAVTGTASLTRLRDALSTRQREGALVSSARPVATVKQWGCKGAWEWRPCWAWSPVFVPYIRPRPSTSR